MSLIQQVSRMRDILWTHTPLRQARDGPVGMTSHQEANTMREAPLP